MIFEERERVMLANLEAAEGKVHAAKTSTYRRPAVATAKKQYVIIRTYSAGVHAGYLKSREGKEAVLIEIIPCTAAAQANIQAVPEWKL